MRNLLFFLAVAALAQTPTQVDYNTQIRNRPISRVATPGTNVLAAAILATPSGGTLTLQSGSYIQTTTATISNPISIACQPGAVIQAGASSLTLLTIMSQVSISGCTFDGQFTQGKTSITAVVGAGGTYLNISQSICQNLDLTCWAIQGMTGTFTSTYNRYTQIGIGASNPSTGILGANTGSNDPNPSLIISDHDTFDTFTSGRAINITQLNLAIRTVIRIDHPTCRNMQHGCFVGATYGAISVDIIDPQLDTFTTGAVQLTAIEWTMCTDVVPGLDLDGSLTITGGTINTGSGHSTSPVSFPWYAIREASRHFALTASRVTGAWSSAVVASGALEAANVEVDGATNGIIPDPLNQTTQLSWSITNSLFREICKNVVSGQPASLLVANSTFSRTPASATCTNDSTIPYTAIVANALSTGGVNVNGNLFVLLAGTAPGGSLYAGISDVSSGLHNVYSGNQFIDYNATKIFNGFYLTASPGQYFNGSVITGNTFIVNNAINLVGAAPCCVTAFKTGGNVDLGGNIRIGSQGSYALDNSQTTWGLNAVNCLAATHGNKVNFVDALTATWGGVVSAGSGTNPVTASCNAAAPLTGGFYQSGGTVAGTIGQTCNIAIAGGSTAVVALTGTNVIAPGTAFTGVSGGSSYIRPPTTAIFTNGTATCSGAPVILSTLGSSIGYTVISK